MWWRNYCGRNDSYIKDLFCGQLRSSVTCKACGNVSRCFDPFWDLSVRWAMQGYAGACRACVSWCALRHCVQLPIPKAALLKSHGSCALEDCLNVRSRRPTLRPPPFDLSF